MANNIALAKTFVPILDEIYKLASLTSKLDGAAELARQGANANELIVPMLSMQGLGDYSRNDGYVKGDVTMTNETVKCNYDRGRKFYVDALDNEETAKLAFSRLSGEFIRTKVVPELDAFRFASYAGKSGISKATAADLPDGASVLAALRAAITKMDEDEVPTENRHLFITPTLDGMIADLDTTKSREILTRFATKTLVPQTRFYTAIDMLDGKTTGEEAGGYKKRLRCKEHQLHGDPPLGPDPVPEAHGAQNQRAGGRPGRRPPHVRISDGGHRGCVCQQAGGHLPAQRSGSGGVKYADSRFDLS